MIWDFIRDFLVEYIFGGVTSDGQWFGGMIGSLANYDGDYAESHSQELYLYLGEVFNGADDRLYNSISLGDWLSTTTTIIIMCVIVFLFALLVRWIFKAVTSAFLLK